jgi:hypothetical protein
VALLLFDKQATTNKQRQPKPMAAARATTRHLQSGPSSSPTGQPHFSTARYFYVGPLNYSTPTGILAISHQHPVDENYIAWINGRIVSTDFAIVDESVERR